ncbi:hypothetical protein [Dankookia sp. P2]
MSASALPAPALPAERRHISYWIGAAAGRRRADRRASADRQ